MSSPRGIEERIDWFQTHNPSGSGMCAQHTWHALGGNNGNPPAWSCSDANECVDKVKASGRYWTPSTWDGPPPRGAWVGWKYGSNGHAALSNGDGTISTTDPSSDQGMCGIENLDYPKKWGFSTSNGPYTVWTDQYNGVRFEVGAGMVDVYNYKYSGKSEDTKEIPLNEYTWVTKDTDDPAASGLEFKLIYLNVRLRWARRGVTNIRVKYVREGDDPTAYQDYRVVPLEEDPTEYPLEEDFLITHMHMEAGEKGIGGKWYVKITGVGLTSAAVDTRYNKYATIKDNG